MDAKNAAGMEFQKETAFAIRVIKDTRGFKAIFSLQKNRQGFFVFLLLVLSWGDESETKIA